MAFGGVHPFMLKSGSGSGDLFSVTPCAGGANVLCEDTLGESPIVDDVVMYGDGTTFYCGTVAATGQGGTAAFDIDSTGYADCDDCALML